MTGFMHEREFSRKTFLKGSGVAVVGASVVGAGLTGKASAARPALAGYNADPAQLDSWLVVNPDNTIILRQTKVETGNGITTGFLEVVAEELDHDMALMRYGPSQYNAEGAMNTRVDTWDAVNTGGEGGSNAMSGTGPQIRAVAAAARIALLNMASAQMGVPAASLTVSKGVVSGGGKQMTYGQIMGGKTFNATLASLKVPATLHPGVAPAKPIASYTTVTKRDMVTRIDIPAKVNGTYTYVHNIRVPGMLHGRVVFPRGQAAYGFGTPVVSVDESSISHLRAQVVRKGDFIGVVAAREYDAIQAAAQLKVEWATPPVLSGVENLFASWRAMDSAGQAPAARAVHGSTDFDYNINPDKVDAALASAVHVVSSSYK